MKQIRYDRGNFLRQGAAALFVLVFAYAGAYHLHISHAATTVAASQAESGTVKSPAESVSDATASGNAAVRFGNDQTNGSTTCPSPTPAAPVSGLTIAACEDFSNGLGDFAPYDGGGGNTVVGAGRVPSQCTVNSGILQLKQNADGATCGGALYSFTQQQGLWEVRMKVYSTGGTNGSAPHPVLILWPSTEVWNDGELDYFETDIGNPADGYLHCVGANISQNCYTFPSSSVDYSQWHTYSIYWQNGRMTGYIDGQQWWTSTATGFVPSVPMVQTIQLDNLSGSTPVNPGEMDVDWVHMYR